MTKQEQKSKVSREKFINVAFQLLCDQGYAGTSLDDIIQKSNLSKGAFYHHFESKEDLFRQLFDGMIQLVEKSAEQMKFGLREGLSFRDAMLSCFDVKEAHLKSTLFMRSIVELYFVGMRDPWVKKLLQRLQRVIVDMLTEALSLAMSQGKIRKLKNPKEIAEIIHHGSRGVLFMEIILNDGRNLRAKSIRYLDHEMEALRL